MKLSNYFGRLLLLAMISGIAVGNLWGQTSDNGRVRLGKFNWQGEMVFNTSTHEENGVLQLLESFRCIDISSTNLLNLNIEFYVANVFDDPIIFNEEGIYIHPLNGIHIQYGLYLDYGDGSTNSYLNEIPASSFSYSYLMTINGVNLYRGVINEIIDFSPYCSLDEIEATFFFRLVDNNGELYPWENLSNEGEAFDSRAIESTGFPLIEEKKTICCDIVQPKSFGKIFINNDTDENITFKNRNKTLMQMLSESEMTIKPNPFSDKIEVNLDVLELNSTVDVYIYSSSGKVVYQKKLALSNRLNSYMDMDLSFLEQGVYFVHINSEIFNRIQKIIKTN